MTLASARFSQRGIVKENEDLPIDQRIERANLSYGKHLSISLTQRCPLSCAHCILGCLPSNDISLDIREEVITAIIKGLKNLSSRIEQISFTGGEPFLCKDAMRRISDEAIKYDIACGAVTSAFWATNSKEVISRLKAIPSLSHITISYDVYHSEFIPIDRVKNAVFGAEELARTASIRVSIPPNQNGLQNHFLDKLREEFSSRVHTQEILGFGRASNLNIEPIISDRVPLLPCLSSGPHITESGGTIPCCSALDNQIPETHLLGLGNVAKSSLSEVYRNADHNVMLNFIRLWGFPIVVEVLQEEMPERFGQMKFVEEGQCSLCAVIMRDPDAIDILKRWSANIDIRLATAVGAAKHFNKAEVLTELVSQCNGKIAETAGFALS